MRPLSLAALAFGIAFADDLAPGKSLFVAHCAPCHGQTGAGGRGPSLAKPKFKHDDLFKVIQFGIPDTEMPGAWQLTDREVSQVETYVRSLGRIEVAALPGNAQRGKALYAGKGGCPACHIVDGEGIGYGPELSEAGARRSPAYLRDSLLDPVASFPDNFAMVRAILRDGAEIRGIRVNEDSFTIQIRDSRNRFHSLRKADLATLEKNTTTSPMPSYRATFSASEMDDLVAFLASLRGEK
jgi:cytochrome c oxidase cbb3-type subunit 3